MAIYFDMLTGAGAPMAGTPLESHPAVNWSDGGFPSLYRNADGAGPGVSGGVTLCMTPQMPYAAPAPPPSMIKTAFRVGINNNAGSIDSSILVYGTKGPTETLEGITLTIMRISNGQNMVRAQLNTIGGIVNIFDSAMLPNGVYDLEFYFYLSESRAVVLIDNNEVFNSIVPHAFELEQATADQVKVSMFLANFGAQYARNGLWAVADGVPPPGPLPVFPSRVTVPLANFTRPIFSMLQNRGTK